MSAAALRERLALVRRTFGSLDEYARVRVELDDHERAERVAAVVATVPPVVRLALVPPAAPPAPPAAPPRPITGGGLHLLG